MKETETLKKKIISSEYSGHIRFAFHGFWRAGKPQGYFCYFSLYIILDEQEGANILESFTPTCQYLKEIFWNLSSGF